MNQLKDLLKKPTVIITLEIVVALVIGIAVIGLIGIPSFTSWRENSQKTKEIKQKIGKITTNINNLQSVDKEEIKKLEEGFNTLLPSEPELLKFFTLANKIALLSGLTLSTGQAEIGKKVTLGAPPAPKPTPGASSGQGSAGTPTVSSGSNAAGTGSAPNQQTQTSGNAGVKLLFLGSFPNVITLLGNFDKADRATLIREISFSQSENDSDVVISLNFTLPNSSPPASIDAETASLLSGEEKESLSSILDTVSITASPTKNPLGRPDPFR